MTNRGVADAGEYAESVSIVRLITDDPVAVLERQQTLDGMMDTAGPVAKEEIERRGPSDEGG